MNRAVNKQALHPNNPHKGRYDFDKLVADCPMLESYLQNNPVGDRTIDFSDSEAVKCLNKALLAHFYQVKFWQVPAGYLCPPIPGRADYIHYLAALLKDNGIDPHHNVTALDIGTGANCIYPIIGSQSYGWRFVGTDINPVSIQLAKTIVSSNTNLTSKIKLIHQPNAEDIFTSIIKPEQYFTVTMCNPPFHACAEQAADANVRKVNNLARHKGRQKHHHQKAAVESGQAELNFGGQNAELWCDGGELAFITTMIKQSTQYAKQVGWFTTLVSKKSHLNSLKLILANTQAKQVEVIRMSQGQKISHMLAWKF